MRSVYLITVAALLVGVAAAGVWSSNMNQDTYVDSENPETAFNNAETLWVVTDSDVSKMAYLGFVNTFGNIGLTDPDSVKSAKFEIYASDVTQPGIVDIYFLEGATLSTMTWDTKDEYDSGTKVEVSVESPGLIEVDATPLVKKAIEACTTGCPFTFVLVAQSGTAVGFASSDSPDYATKLSYTT